MPPGTRNVFGADLDDLRDWNRGDKLEAAHFQEPVDAIRKLASIGPGSQVLPTKGGVSAGVASKPATWKPDAQFLVDNVQITDAIQCFRWGPYDGRGAMKWMILKPW